MEQGNKLDFWGQSIYVGLDVHKKSWSVSIFSEQCEHKKFTQPRETDKLAHYLKRNFPGANYHSVYEAGFSGFWTHNQLQEHGVNCIVVHPADVPTTNKERRSKRDRIDCRKLARSLRNGELQGIYVPTRPQLEDRSLVEPGKVWCGRKPAVRIKSSPFCSSTGWSCPKKSFVVGGPKSFLTSSSRSGWSGTAATWPLRPIWKN